MPHTTKHRILKWLWLLFGFIGLIDYFLISGTIANSIPVLFTISVAANVIAHWAAEEAAED